MNITNTNSSEQDEKIIALKHYILNAPASNAEHQQALKWLHGIMQDYSNKIHQLKQELDTLKKADQCQN